MRSSGWSPILVLPRCKKPRRPGWAMSPNSMQRSRSIGRYLVVLTGRDEPQGTFSRLLDAAQAGFRVVQLTEFFEYAFGRVPIEDLSHDWFLSVLHLYQRRYSRAIKRALDLVGATVLLLLTLPLFPLLALLVQQNGGSRDIAAGAAWRTRKALHHLQVPDDARGCRGLGTSHVGGRSRIRGSRGQAASCADSGSTSSHSSGTSSAARCRSSVRVPSAPNSSPI